MCGVSGFRSLCLVLAKDARFQLRQYPEMLQEGLEPPTLGLLDPCSTKLSYQSWVAPSGFVPVPVATDNARDHLRVGSP